MSFQVSSGDGTEIKESVAMAEEEFKNSTAEETERKLIPEDQEEFKNSRTEKLKRKLIHKDEEDFKSSTVEESERKVIPEDEEDFKSSTVEESERKVIPEDEEDFKSSTVEESERKVIPEDEDEEVEYSGDFRLPYNRLQIAPISINGRTDLKRWIDPESLSGRLFPKKKKRKDFHLEDKDDEEDKEIPRTQSMDNLLLMQKPQHQ